MISALVSMPIHVHSQEHPLLHPPTTCPTNAYLRSQAVDVGAVPPGDEEAGGLLPAAVGRELVRPDVCLGLMRQGQVVPGKASDLQAVSGEKRVRVLGKRRKAESTGALSVLLSDVQSAHQQAEHCTYHPRFRAPSAGALFSTIVS